MSNYITLEQLRKNSTLGDLAIDEEGQRALDAAEEAIESYCSRRFYEDAQDVTRYFTADRAGEVRIDDLVTLTTLETDDDADGVFETTWGATESFLSPYNAAEDNRPYTSIEAAPPFARVFPRTRRGVKVTGKFGWPAVPDAVAQATIIQATRFLKRARSSPMGIETVAIDGTPVRIRNKLDPDVEVMLMGLRRIAVA